MPSTSAYLLCALVATAAAQGTTPPKTYADCEDVVVFFSRGNDAPYHDDRVSGYISEICDKFEGLNYSCDYIDIVFDATQGGDYCAQVAEGAANGVSEITDFNARCPNSKIVINGYSEGGNVAGDVLGGEGGNVAGAVSGAPGACSGVSTGIDPSSQAGQAISAVTLFGDTRHTADQPYNVLDGASKSARARTGDDLARLNRYSDVLRSYCAAADPVCAGGDDITYHLNYFELYSDEASDWIVGKVVPLLKQEAASSTSSAVVSSTSSASSSIVASSISSVSAISTTVASTTNSTTSLHQITSALNGTSAAQPTPYSTPAVFTLIDTDNTTTQASPGHGWNQTATAYSWQPVTTLVTIGASSATTGPSPSTVEQSSAGSPPSAPGSYVSDSNTQATSPDVSVTQVVTQYTTVCPAESTYASDGQQQTTTYDYLVTSTRTSAFLTTITLAPASPAQTGLEYPQPHRPQQWEQQGHQPHPKLPNHPSHPEQSTVVYTTTAPASTTTTYLSAGQWHTETFTSFMTYTTSLTQHITSTYLTTATREASSSVVAAPYPVNNQTVPAAYNSSAPRTTFLSSTLKTIQVRPSGYWNEAK
ncbi:hypothetical protein LTS10_010064 [Elasticomyces elasticus]|nr:hypothetical protein LTS10_010064 [Elasticomyces elasticus]